MVLASIWTSQTGSTSPFHVTVMLVFCGAAVRLPSSATVDLLSSTGTVPLTEFWSIMNSSNGRSFSPVPETAPNTDSRAVGSPSAFRCSWVAPSAPKLTFTCDCATPSSVPTLSPYGRLKPAWLTTWSYKSMASSNTVWLLGGNVVKSKNDTSSAPSSLCWPLVSSCVTSATVSTICMPAPTPATSPKNGLSSSTLIGSVPPTLEP